MKFPIVTADEFRAHLREVLMIASTFFLVIVSCVAVSVGFDIHAMRINEIQGGATLRTEAFSRIDSLLWKVDTLISVMSATNKALASGLTQVRVQVKESSDDQAKSIKATSNAATAVVKEVKATIESNQEVLEKVSEAPKPVVNVELPKPAAPIVVTQPATTQPIPATVPVLPAAVPRKHHSHWRWLRHLRLGREHDGRAD